MSERRFSILTTTEAEERLQRKLQELERLERVQSLTAQVYSLLTQLNTEIGKIQLGTESVAKLTTNWIQVVRAVSLAANSMLIYNDDDFKDGVPTTERLVRCALDELGTIVKDLRE